MKLRELTGYKNNPIYKQAKQDVGDSDTDPEVKHAGFDRFTNYLHQHGFNRLGAGGWSNIYEKPGYPWVFKLFKADPPYLSYFNYCKQHQNNPHVPKIKGNLIKITNDTFCIRMEKLTPYPKFDGFIDLVWHAVDDIETDDDDYTAHIEKLSQLYPHIIDLLKFIVNSQFVEDLNISNFMLRGNTPVITDPLANSSF